MRARATIMFPFAIALALPPAGLVLGLAQFIQDRALGLRLIATAVVGFALWALLLT